MPEPPVENRFLVSIYLPKVTMFAQGSTKLQNHDVPFAQGQYPLLNLNHPELLRQQQRGMLRGVQVVDAENLRLRERFLAAEAERQRRREAAAVQRDRGPLTGFLRRLL